MNTWRHPSLNQILRIHKAVIARDGGSDGIRSQELLESALAAPQASFSGEPIMNDGIEIAAAYLYYLCRDHPFIDGNKRVALATCLIFLKINNFSLQADSDYWEQLVLDVANSQLDRIQTTARLYVLINHG